MSHTIVVGDHTCLTRHHSTAAHFAESSLRLTHAYELCVEVDDMVY